MKNRVKMTIAYDGTDFSGWQRQPNYLTVQEVVEDALEKVCGEFVEIFASGRTDKGVHAIGQVVHFDHNSTIPDEKFAIVLNQILRDDVTIVSSSSVPADFNARYTAKIKTYRYYMYKSEFINPTKERYAVRVSDKIDINKMKNACKDVLGRHDFYGLSKRGSSATTSVREVFSADIFEEGDSIYFEISASGFLYNMVRIIVGTLIDIGMGKMAENSLKLAIELRDRGKAGRTCPPNGLFLQKVGYIVEKQLT